MAEVRTKQKKKRSLSQRRAMKGFIFILPWLIGFIWFYVRSLVMTVQFSFSEMTVNPGGGYSLNFVGLNNFIYAFRAHATYKQVLTTSIGNMLIDVPLITFFSLFMAMLLNRKFKGRTLVRAIFFLPVIIVSGPILGMLNAEGAGSITALDTQAITDAISGFLPAALAKPISSIFENMITILWYSGVQILIFLSALQKIDPSQYEAAKIDGGSGWECFWKITLPTIKPMILLNCVYTIVFISNNDQNEIIELIKNAMFSGTREKGYGYASAMAWVYSIVVLLIVGIFALLFITKKDVYEKQVKKAKKQMKKDERELKRVRRRSARNAAKQARKEAK